MEPFSGTDKWNSYRDLYQREGPHPQTHSGSLNPYVETVPEDQPPSQNQQNAPDSSERNGYFPFALRPAQGATANIQSGTATATLTANAPDLPTSSSSAATSSPAASSLNFNMQYSFPGHPHRRSLRSWIHELPNDGQISGSFSSTRNSVGLDLDPTRRPSVTSTTADTESLMSPSSSRASPRPMGPNFHHMRLQFPPMPLDAVSIPPTPPATMLPPQQNGTRGIAAVQPVQPHLSMPTVPTMSGFATMAALGTNLPHVHSPMPTYQPPRSAPVVPTYVPELAPAAAPPAEPLPPSAARFIAIGMDFGTTYSGVSWAFSRDPLDIKDAQQYPCVSSAIKGRDEVQVPTQYDQRSGAWGYLLDKGHAPIKWFKLLLLRDEDIREDIRNSPYLQAARRQASALGDDGAINLVADFLRNIWQHCLREIEFEIDAQTLQNLPFKVALTIPAIWPQYARNMMKEAARRAGILERRDIADTTLILVEEPEAAALQTLLDRREYPDMAVGETFVVCDCGGGTIDIISYKVMDTKPFVIREAVRGDGKLCGAFLVDDCFEHYMKNLAGLRFENCDPADFRKFVKDEWEYGIKRAFSGGEAQEEFILQPPIKAFPWAARLKGSNKIVLKKNTVVGFFDGSLKGIRELINDQYQKIVIQDGKPPKKILLVGGFGGSRYLLRKLQTEYDNVMQPQHHWSAVARGAVIKLLKNTFSQKDVVAAADERQKGLLNFIPEMDVRIARHSYGVETGVPLAMAFPPVAPGGEGDRITTEPDGQQRVWRMQWYLRQGDEMDNREPVSHKFYEYVTRSSSRQATFLIYTSDRLPPPARRDASCQLLCTIHCDYDTPFHELPVVDEARGMRMVDDMRLTMRFNGEPEWHLQIGTKTAERKVDVEFPRLPPAGRQGGG